MTGRSLTACPCPWKNFTSSSRETCSTARDQLISKGNHSAPLFHASVAAPRLYTHSFLQVQACIDRCAPYSKNNLWHTRWAGSETFSHHRETDMSGVIAENHHSTVDLCFWGSVQHNWTFVAATKYTKHVKREKNAFLLNCDSNQKVK